MDNKPAQNIQDTFLNTVRKDKTPITIYLVSGVKLTGKIRSFDKYSVLLENNSQEQLIFKHAISTVVSTRSVLHSDHRPSTGVGHPPASAPGLGGARELMMKPVVGLAEASMLSACMRCATVNISAVGVKVTARRTVSPWVFAATIRRR